MKTGLDRVSVVIPSYNHAPYIAEAIRSVAAQDVPDLELVIVDDGSTDESVKRIREELEQTSLERVVFLQQENRGTHGAIARGMTAASGSIIALLNSDDRFAPDRLRRMAPHFAGRDEFLAFSMVRVIGASGAPLPAPHPTTAGYHHALECATRLPTVGFGLLCNNFAVTSGNFVFSRNLYERLGGFSHHRLAHDWDFLLRALVYVEPIFVPERLVDYRSHESNTLRTVEDLKEQEGSEILNRYLDLCENDVQNPLAPCPRNWPLYFDLFSERHAPWFGGPSIRSWLHAAGRVEGEATARSDRNGSTGAADLESVDDRRAILDPGGERANLDALARAREVLARESDADIHGADGDALRTRPVAPIPRARTGAARTAGATRNDEAQRADRTTSPSGRDARRRISALIRRLRALITLRSHASWEIEHSRLFDAEYYIAANGLTSLRPKQALRHYLEKGAKRRLAPHPLFDTAYYLDMNPDVARSGSNPLLHFVRHGAAEGREPHPLFASGFYLAHNPDVAAMGMNPLTHYVEHGAFEGRAPHPLFDPDFYRAHCTEPIPDDVSPLAHYVIVGARLGIPISRRDQLHARLNPARRDEAPSARGRDRGPFDRSSKRMRRSIFFDADYYARHIYDRTDVVDPLRHFIEVGSLEGLPCCPPEGWITGLHAIDARGATRAELAYLRAERPTSSPRDAHVDLLVSRTGNPLYREIAEHLADALFRIGAQVRVADESEEPNPGATHTVVVAPHEYFVLGEGPKRFEEGLLARSFILMAESPGSSFFSMGVWFAQRAAGVLDVNPASALVWGEMGHHARFLPLSRDDAALESAPACRVSVLRGALARSTLGAPPTREACFEERPIDILFDAEGSERRKRFFARESALFASLRCAIYMPTPELEATSGPESALRRSESAALARQSKIVLVLRRDELPLFDWHRAIARGVGHGALLVAEASTTLPGLTPGIDYLESPAVELPRLLRWLLETPEGRAEAEAVRLHGVQTLERAFAEHDVLGRFLSDPGIARETSARRTGDEGGDTR